MPSMAKLPIWLPNPPTRAATIGTRISATSGDVIRSRIRTRSATIVATPNHVSIQAPAPPAFPALPARAAVRSFAQARGNLTRRITAFCGAGQDVRGRGSADRALGVFTQEKSRLDQLLCGATN